MTEQQTAATDNALLEKLLRKKYLREEMHENKGMELFPCDADDYGAEEYNVNPNGPEAAERIKSLQAEVELEKAAHREAVLLAIEVEADRQRMREALEAIADDPFSDIEGVRIFARQALNHTSKEANDARLAE